MNAPDLTPEEQDHVRSALRFVRALCGTWESAAKVLHFTYRNVSHVMGGGTVSPTMAVRVAKFAKVGVDDVLTGRFPPADVCPHCGNGLPEQPDGGTADGGRT